MRGRFLVPVMWAPTRSPMLVMLISAPSVKNIMPTITRSAPMRNTSSMAGCMGAMLKHSTRTMATMGSTATSASSSFLWSFGFLSFKGSPQGIVFLQYSIFSWSFQRFPGVKLLTAYKDCVNTEK